MNAPQKKSIRRWLWIAGGVLLLLTIALAIACFQCSKPFRERADSLDLLGIRIPPAGELSYDPATLARLIELKDPRFYHHKGLDYQAMGRALLADLLGGEGGRIAGTNTITYEVARRVLPPQKRGYDEHHRAISAKFLAPRLEQTFTKEEIIRLYLFHYDLTSELAREEEFRRWLSTKANE